MDWRRNKKLCATISNGGQWTLAEAFTKVESGKKDENRPQLARALQTCRVYGAKLVGPSLTGCRERVIPAERVLDVPVANYHLLVRPDII